MRGHSVTQARRVSRSVYNRTLARAMRNALLAVCVLLPVLAESTGCGLNQYAYPYLQVVIQNLICQPEYIGTYDMMWGESQGGFPVYKKQNENKYLFKDTRQWSCQCWVLSSKREFFQWKVRNWCSGNANPGSIRGLEACPGTTTDRVSILRTNELSTCMTCPSFSNSPSGSAAASACTCNAGYTGANGGTCSICAAGKYQVDSASAEGGPNGGVCTDCVAGKYKISAGTTECSNCLAGKYSTVTSAVTPDVCISCPSDSNTAEAEASDSQADCTCNSGYTGNNGGSCNACAIGKYKAALHPDRHMH